MTIDESILYMELYKRNLFNSISDLDKDIEAYNIAIDIMRKYQKIKKIYDNWNVDFGWETFRAMRKIGRILKDGNND